MPARSATWQAESGPGSGRMQGRRIASETLVGLGLAPEQFQVLPANAGVKVQWARRLRRETTLNLKWVAQELGVGSCKYLSNLLEQQAPTPAQPHPR